MSGASLPILYMRNLRQFPRIPTVLIFGIAMPVLQLVMFGSIFSATTDLPNHPHADANYYAFIAPAIVLLTTFLGMANASAAFLVDLRTGYFDKLRTTPANAAVIIGARLMAEMTRVAGQAILILGVAYLLGARVATGFGGAVTMIAACVLFSGLSVGLLVTALAMKTKSDQATQSAFPLFFIFIFLSTAYMPEQLLPGWLQTAIKFNPIDYLIQGLRALMLDGWTSDVMNLVIAMGAAVVLGLLLVGLNVRVYRGMVE